MVFVSVVTVITMLVRLFKGSTHFISKVVVNGKVE